MTPAPKMCIRDSAAFAAGALLIPVTCPGAYGRWLRDVYKRQAVRRAEPGKQIGRRVPRADRRPAVWHLRTRLLQLIQRHARLRQQTRGRDDGVHRNGERQLIQRAVRRHKVKQPRYERIRRRQLAHQRQQIDAHKMCIRDSRGAARAAVCAESAGGRGSIRGDRAGRADACHRRRLPSAVFIWADVPRF